MTKNSLGTIGTTGVPNIRDINLYSLSKGELVECEIIGTQGFDASKFDFRCSDSYFNHFVLTRK